MGTVSFHVWVLVQSLVWTALLGTALPLDRPSPGPPFPWAALSLDRPPPGPPFPWTAQNFTLFYPLPPQNSFLSSLSGCLLVEFWWCLKCRGPEMCTFGLSKRAHLSAPALQTPPKFHEKTPREGRKERILWRERGKKARNFGPPTLRGLGLALVCTLKKKTNNFKKSKQLKITKKKQFKKIQTIDTKNPNNCKKKKQKKNNLKKSKQLISNI